MGASRKQERWADHYTRKARQAKYPARSVYKLKELQQKYHLIRPGQRVLDLGCAPGAWLLYAAQLVGPQGCVAGVDLKAVEIALPSQARAYQGDIFDAQAPFWLHLDAPFDVVISDMAPSTTGNKHTDAARSTALSETALYVARNHLAAGGHWVCKIFQGVDFSHFRDEVRRCFKKHGIFKPRSSRKASKEIYIIGLEHIKGAT